MYLLPVLATAIAAQSKPNDIYLSDLQLSRQRDFVAVLGSSDGPKPSSVLLFKIDSNNRLRFVAERFFDLPLNNLRFSPDGRYLAVPELVGSDTIKVHLMSTDKLKVIAHMSGMDDLAQVAFTPDSRYVIASNYTAIMYRTTDGLRVRSWAPLGVEHCPRIDMAERNGELEFVMAGDEDVDHVENHALGDLHLHTVSVKKTHSFATDGASMYHHREVAFDGDLDKHTLTLYDLRTGAKLWSTRQFVVQYINWTPSNNLVGGRTADKKSLIVWPPMHPEHRKEVKPPIAPISQDWRFMSDGVFSDGGAKFYSVANGKLLLTIEAKQIGNNVEWIACTPDGSFAGSDNCRDYFHPKVSRLRRRESRISLLLRSVAANKHI